MTETDEPDGEPAASERFRVADWPLHYLLAIGRCHVRNMGLVLAPFDCSPLVWRVLSVLNEENGRSIGYLAEISVIDRSNLSRIIDAVERAGLVTKDCRPGDKRQTLVFITDAGRALFARSLPAVLDYYARLLDGLDAGERSMLMSILRKIKLNVCGPQSDMVGW